MSIVIHGVDAPASCAACKGVNEGHYNMLGEQINPTCDYDVAGRELDWHLMGKPAWCPIRQIDTVTYKNLKLLEESGFEL